MSQVLSLRIIISVTGEAPYTVHAYVTGEAPYTVHAYVTDEAPYTSLIVSRDYLGAPDYSCKVPWARLTDHCMQGQRRQGSRLDMPSTFIFQHPLFPLIFDDLYIIKYFLSFAHG
jgi:hypothetical protein